MQIFKTGINTCTKPGFLPVESCDAQYTARWICSQTLIYIHIYTSLVKICTLHITVHTSHQLLANTRTLMKPKMTALKQARGLVFPSGEVSLGYTFQRDCFPERQVKKADQVPEIDLQLLFLLQQLLTASCPHPSSGCQVFGFSVCLQHHFFIFMSASMAQRRHLVPPS